MKQDKDVSRYDMVLAQSLDGTRARAKWIERSTAELKQWLENWKKEKGGA
jgi:aminopeptidase 2